MSEQTDPGQGPVQVEIMPATPEMDASTPGPGDETAGDDLGARLKQAESRVAELEDAWLRAKAEAENVRRRSAEEAEKARKFALERFSSDLLAVKDSLEATLAVDAGVTLESIKSGVELTLKQLVGVFERHGLVEVNPIDARFDPNLHQAVGVVEDGGEANTIASVLQKGYLLNDRVVRPALVMVRKAAAASSP